MSVTAPTTAAPVSAQKTNYVKKPSQEEKDQTLKEIEANMEKIRPRLVSTFTSHHASTAFNEVDYPAFLLCSTQQSRSRAGTPSISSSAKTQPQHKRKRSAGTLEKEKGDESIVVAHLLSSMANSSNQACFFVYLVPIERCP